MDAGQSFQSQKYGRDVEIVTKEQHKTCYIALMLAQHPVTSHQNNVGENGDASQTQIRFLHPTGKPHSSCLSVTQRVSTIVLRSTDASFSFFSSVL